MQKLYKVKEVEINRIQGGICIKIMDEPIEKKAKKQRVALRLPTELVEKIEKVLAEEPIRISRNEWIERTLKEIVGDIDKKPYRSVCY